MSTVSSTLQFQLLGKPTWVWLVFLVTGWVLNRTMIRGFLRRRRESQFRLEQRRRHNIPDSDHRPFKIALAAAELRAREDLAEKRRAEQTEKEKKRVEEKTKDFGHWERRFLDAGNARQRKGDDAPQSRRDSVKEEEDKAATSSRPRPRRQPSSHNASPPKPIPARLTNRPPPLRNVSNRLAPPARVPSSRPLQPIKKRGRSSTDPEDEEGVEERQIKSLRRGAKADSGKRQRQVSTRAQEDVEMDSDTVRSDEDEDFVPQDDDEEMQGSNDDMDEDLVDDTGSEDMVADSPQKLSAVQQGKKRLIDDVDAESTVAGSGGRARGGGGKRRRSRNSGDDRRPEFIETSSSGEDSGPRTRRKARRSTRPTPSKALPKRIEARPSGTIKRELPTEHVAGDQWTDAAGSMWKKRDDGVTLRLAAVKEERKKFPMPQDSDHPDSMVDMFIYVEKWLTPEQYQKAKDEKFLSWQADESKSNLQSHMTSPASALLAPRLRPSTSLASLKAGSRNFTPLRRSVLASQSPGLGDLSFSPSSLSRSSSTMSLSRSLAGGGISRTLTPSRSILGLGTPERKQLSEAGRLQRQEELMKRLRGPSVSDVKSDTSTPVLSDSIPATTETKISSATSLIPQTDKGPANASSGSKTVDFSFSASQNKSTEGEKPATPAFNFGSTSTAAPALTPASSSTTAASFSFGAKTAEPAKESTKTSAAPTFNFGQTSSSTTTTPAVTTPPVNSSTTAAAPSFSFGANKAQSPAPATGSTPSFSFGATNKSTAAPSSTTPLSPAAPPAAAPPTFSFGATAAPAAASTSTPSFSFGANPSASQNQAQPSATSSFSFGAQPASQPAQPTPPTQTSAPSTSFTFGATAPSQPTFSFGSSSSPAPAPNATPAAGGFSFGAAPAPTTNPGARPMRPLRSRTGGISTAANTQPGGNNSDTSMASNSNRSASPATFSFGAPAAATGGFSFGAANGKRGNGEDEQGSAKKTFSFGS